MGCGSSTPVQAVQPPGAAAHKKAPAPAQPAAGLATVATELAIHVTTKSSTVQGPSGVQATADKPGAPTPAPAPTPSPAPAPAKKKSPKPWVIGETPDIRTLYDFSNILGKGQFGTTRLARSKKTKELVACKSINKRKLTAKEDIEDVQREVQILHLLAGHPNIVGIKEVCEDIHYVHIIMELATGGELFDRIVEKGRYTEKDAADAFRTMVSIIAHCHQMGVMHRDLKPENFLLASKDADAALKATDFGLSVFYAEGQRFRDIVGSAFYVAPEVLRRNYGKEADVWSLGIMLYILLSGVPPFYGESEAAIFQEVLTGNLDLDSAPWPKISEPAKELIRHILVRDPTRRMTCAEILKHPWVVPDGASDEPIQSEVVTRLQGFAGMNMLKKEALKIIVNFLPENEIRGLREMFQNMDTDNSGTVTVDELMAALRSKGSAIPEEDVQTLVDSLDVNANGTIDYEEFLAATIHQSKLQQEENLLQAFQVLDADGSGYIDRDELIKALVKNGAVDDLDSILAQVDKNNDGQVDYEEFCEMMLSTAQAAPPARGKPGSAQLLGGRVKDRANLKIEGDMVQLQ